MTVANLALRLQLHRHFKGGERKLYLRPLNVRHVSARVRRADEQNSAFSDLLERSTGLADTVPIDDVPVFRQLDKHAV